MIYQCMGGGNQGKSVVSSPCYKHCQNTLLTLQPKHIPSLHLQYQLDTRSLGTTLYTEQKIQHH